MGPFCLYRLKETTAGLLLFAAGLCSGCGRPEGEREVFPTTGELFVHGEPAAGALVAFHPLGEDSPDQWPLGFPHALVDAAGKFSVSTYRPGDGCPAGEYVVLVTWPTEAAAGDGDEEEEDAETADRLGGRYATRDVSPLQATVEARPTALPRYELN